MREAVSAEALVASERLDHVDSLPVGRMFLGTSFFGRGDAGGGLAGGALTYEHRPTDALSLFAEGWAGYGWGDQAGFGYGASAGLRWRW